MSGNDRIDEINSSNQKWITQKKTNVNIIVKSKNQINKNL